MISPAEQHLSPGTRELIDRVASARFQGDVSEAKFRQIVLLALKEQDKRTRHACADAVADAPVGACPINACINVQAI